MKKRKIVLTSLLSSILFVGCGGAGDVSSSISNIVQVERGAVLNATVTDANGNTAIPVSPYSNSYKFDTSIAYPIVVSSGIIDVNANGQIDTEDIRLTTTLKSSTKKVSLISTLIYNTDKNIENQNLEKLLDLTKTQLNLSSLDKEKLLDLPSSSKESMIITNALYQNFKQNSTNTQDYIEGLFDTNNTTRLDDVKANISSLKTTFESNINQDLKQKAALLETQVVNDLQTSSLIQKLTSTQVEEIKKELEKKTPQEDNKQDVSYLLNKTFYEYEKGYEDLAYVVHEYKNSYKAKVQRHYKSFISNSWKIDDLTKDYDSLKVQNNSIVTQYMGYTQTLKIKSFSSDHLVVTLQSVNSNKNINDLKEMKWYFKSPR